MLNLSQTGPIDELITAVEALPAQTHSVDAPFAQQAKDLAIACLRNLRSDTVTHATLNLRAHTLPSLNALQFEIQVSGRKQ